MLIIRAASHRRGPEQCHGAKTTKDHATPCCGITWSIPFRRSPVGLQGLSDRPSESHRSSSIGQKGSLRRMESVLSCEKQDWPRVQWQPEDAITQIFPELDDSSVSHGCGVLSVMKRETGQLGWVLLFAVPSAFNIDACCIRR